MCDLFDHTNGGDFCALSAPHKKKEMLLVKSEIKSIPIFWWIYHTFLNSSIKKMSCYNTSHYKLFLSCC